ncbi:MAG: class I SAM-dependent methyltransferase [Candidatus Nealsonbacteria bacterium]|nr:class I SAM-dependent methyltransferase [Candidatus Nealsonbacteria bacterium]
MFQDTSFGKEIIWGEYQKNLILPKLQKLLNLKKGDKVLDLGCGAGYFTRQFAKSGANIIGVDVSKEIIDIARRKSPKNVRYYTASADKLPFPNKTIDKIIVILALQNMENVFKVFKECRRVLKPKGKLFIVMNHPAFRIPGASSWGWDQNNKIQYRRIDKYLSNLKVEIKMHPGKDSQSYTFSFHRPVQAYFNAIFKNNFCVSRLEEWVSFKKSQPGPRAKAEDLARSQIPLFLYLEAIKMD